MISNIPIPHDTAAVYNSNQGACDNFGLLFDRFVRYENGWMLEGEAKSTEAFQLVAQCNRLANRPNTKKLYAQLGQRQQAIAQMLQAATFTAKPEWRLAMGLGNESVFETGMTLHPVFGCPVVPGSALKGMTHAWARIDDKTSDGTISRVFGPEPDEIDPETGEKADRAGSVVFYDALPITPPNLQLDLINPHYPDYYQKDGKQKAFPSDWQSPKPVYFITVSSETTFRFTLGGRSAVRDAAQKAQTAADVQTAVALLEAALQNMGTGGKTTSGYGYWSDFRGGG